MEINRALFAALDPDRQHAAKSARHLFGRDIMPGVACKARILDLFDFGVVFEMFGNGHRIGRCPFNTDRKRAHPAQQKPCFKHTQNRTARCMLFAHTLPVFAV